MRFVWLLAFIVTTNALAQIQTLEQGEQVIRYQCGACHSQSLPTSVEGALKVFNLEDRFWVSKLTDRVRQEMVSRVAQRIGMSDYEVSYLMPKGWKPLPKRPSKNDVVAVKKYLEAEKDSNKLKKILGLESFRSSN